MKPEDTTVITARCFYGEAASCSHPCPFLFDIRTFLMRAKEGKWGLAYKLYRNATVFPAIVGELCDAPCRAECQRGIGPRRLQRAPMAEGKQEVWFVGDEPVDVRAIESAAVRFAKDRRPETYRVPPKPQRIAVVGAGLAGLSLALNLAQKAYPVTVFERGEKALWTWSAHPKYESFLEEIALQFSSVEVEFIYGLKITGPDDPALAGFAYVYHATNHTGQDAMTAIADSIEKSKAIEAWLQTGEWPEDESDGVSGEGLPVIPEKHYLDHIGEPTKPIVIAADPSAGYTKEEAMSEASRCMGCDCRACMDACEMLGRYNKRPQKIAVEAYSDTKSAPPLSSSTLTRETYSCNLCGYCRSVCPVDVDLEKLFYLARVGRAETGKHPCAFHDFWLKDFEWHRSEGAYFVPGAKREYLFFPGCKLGARAPSQVLDAAVFLKERYGAGILLDCCGAPAYWAGEEPLFQAHLDGLRERWERSEKPTFVFACAYCIRLFQEFLPEISMVSVYELLAENGLPGSGSFDTGCYTVFDPCMARNFPDMESAVRRLAAVTGTSLTELTEKNHCCGFGGHMRTANPELYDVIAGSRSVADEAPYLVYCANCAETFATYGKAHKHILDFIFPDDKTASLTEAPRNLQRKRDNAILTKSALSELYEDAVFRPDPQAKDDLSVNLSDLLIRDMDRRLILTDDIKQAIYQSEQTNEIFILRGGAPGGRDLHQCRLIGDMITTWILYTKGSDTAINDPIYTIIDVWNHRMRYTEEERIHGGKATSAGWICMKCGIGLVIKDTIFSYMGMTFSHEAERCPVCGMVFISKDLADGKMAEVEQMMEDK